MLYFALSGQIIKRIYCIPEREGAIILIRTNFEYSRILNEAKREDLEIGVRVISQT